MSLFQCRKPQGNSLQEIFNGGYFGPFFPLVETVVSRNSSEWVPSLDVIESKEQYIIKVDLPGFKKEEVLVSFDNGVLTIEGERKTSTEQKEENYYYVERSSGRFVRSLNLGNAVDANKIQASYQDGVLEVTVPKAEQAKPKAIDVK